MAIAAAVAGWLWWRWEIRSNELHSYNISAERKKYIFTNKTMGRARKTKKMWKCMLKRNEEMEKRAQEKIVIIIFDGHRRETRDGPNGDKMKHMISLFLLLLLNVSVREHIGRAYNLMDANAKWQRQRDSGSHLFPCITSALGNNHTICSFFD